MKLRTKFNISSLFLWSVISAAFIGPGTVTTALKSGSAFGSQLLWAIVFSILACYILQEAASRITIGSGKDLPDLIDLMFHRQNAFSLGNWLSGAVIFGCVAYQAGNMVGAMKGIQLTVYIPDWAILSIIYLFAAIILWSGKIKIITRTLGFLVAGMAFIFIILIFNTKTFSPHFFGNLLIPTIPRNSSLVIIGLIGTTIVPYNLFLGSGLSLNRKLGDTRIGLFYSILIGGIITMAILLSGTLVYGEFSFENMFNTLENQLGSWAGPGFALGLFAAGITSSITAPFAAAITGKKLYKNSSKQEQYFRMIWLGVLTSGALFAFLDYDPVALIIAAQALNGLILPFVAISLFILLSNSDLIPRRYQNSLLQNIIMLIVIGIAIFLGTFHLINTLVQILYVEIQYDLILMISGLFSLLIITALAVYQLIKSDPEP